MREHTINANRAARLTIELAERVLAEAGEDKISATALGVSILGYVCKSLDMEIDNRVIGFINNFTELDSVREAASHDMN